MIITLPMFIKKLINNKNWMTLGALLGFIIYTIAFLAAQTLGWLAHPVAYWTSTIVMVGLGLLACKELIWGLKNNQAANGLYLPFGPAMIVAGFIALVTIVV